MITSDDLENCNRLYRDIHEKGRYTKSISAYKSLIVRLLVFIIIVLLKPQTKEEGIIASDVLRDFLVIGDE